jgi:hypothetical protein
MSTMIMWAVAYNDGTTVYQYNEDGTENKYRDINRDKLVEFTLLRVLLVEGKPDLHHPPFPVRFSLWLEPGQQLIYRRRTQIAQESGEITVIHLVGWQQKVAGITSHDDQIVQSISYVPDCEECFAVINAGRFHDDQCAMAASEFYDWEKELGLE